MIALAVTDIGIKTIVESGLEKDKEISILNDKVKLRRVHNKGLPFNKIEDKPELVKKLSLVATGFVGLQFMFTLLRSGRPIQKLALTLLTAGALSNTFDRCLRGYVIDYIGFESKSEKWSSITFNLADFMILTGSFIMLFANLILGRKKGKEV